jgi:hypothetical protein
MAQSPGDASPAREGVLGRRGTTVAHRLGHSITQKQDVPHSAALLEACADSGRSAAGHAGGSAATEETPQAQQQAKRDGDAARASSNPPAHTQPQSESAAARAAMRRTARVGSSQKGAGRAGGGRAGEREASRSPVATGSMSPRTTVRRRTAERNLLPLDGPACPTCFEPYRTNSPECFERDHRPVLFLCKHVCCRSCALQVRCLSPCDVPAPPCCSLHAPRHSVCRCASSAVAGLV